MIFHSTELEQQLRHNCAQNLVCRARKELHFLLHGSRSMASRCQIRFLCVAAISRMHLSNLGDPYDTMHARGHGKLGSRLNVRHHDASATKAPSERAVRGAVWHHSQTTSVYVASLHNDGRLTTVCGPHRYVPCTTLPGYRSTHGAVAALQPFPRSTGPATITAEIKNNIVTHLDEQQSCQRGVNHLL